MKLNGNAVAQMNNVMGRLTWLEALGLLGDRGGDLFCARGDVSVRIPELGLDVTGREGVLAALKDVSHPRRGRGNVHLLHSAGYRMEGPDKARGHWNTYSFCFREEDGAGRFHAVRYGYLRFTVDFRLEGEGWRIAHLDARSLVWVDPWAYDPDHTPGLLDRPGEEKGLDLGDLKGEPDGETYLELRNLIGLFAQNGPIHAKALFAHREDLSMDLPTVLTAPARGYDGVMAALDDWEARERENEMYLTVQMATDPVITVDGDRGHVRSLALCLDYEGRLRGHTENPYPILPRLAMLDFACVREEGSWKLLGVTERAVAHLEPWSQEIRSGGRCVMLEEVNRVYAPESCARGMAEEVYAAESILPQWTERLKRDDLPTFVPLYMDNSRRSLSIILSRSFFGREAVLKHCNTLINEQTVNRRSMMKYPQFHNGNTPVAQISEDGQFALISWFDFCWGNIGAGVLYDDDVQQRQYFPGVGKYYHSFVKEKGEWKMYRFGWYPLTPWISPWSYTVGKADGWSALDTDAPWPLPFEEAAW